MASFDWLGFLDSNHVPYKTTGREQVSINCPFCTDDPSQHMSINLEGAGWRCWRRPSEHYGRNPNRLVAAIMNVPLSRAAAITGNNVFIPVDFLERVRSTISPPPRPLPKPTSLPDDFRPITNSVICRPYLTYLTRRGFTLDNLSLDNWGIYYCARGPYHGRIIFTVYLNRKLVSWTGRTISKREDLRYRTLSHDAEKAALEGYNPAARAITDYVLWYDDLQTTDCDTLLICEGPMDALKVRALGQCDGIIGTCLFTSNMTEEQTYLLLQVLPRFRRRFLVLDRATMPISVRLVQSFRLIDTRVITVPASLKDPGELQTTKQLRSLLR